MKMWKTLVSLALVLLMMLSMGTALADTGSVTEENGYFDTKLKLTVVDERDQFVEWSYPATVEGEIKAVDGVWTIVPKTDFILEITDFAIREGNKLSVGIYNGGVDVKSYEGGLHPEEVDIYFAATMDGGAWVIDESNYSKFGTDIPTSKTIGLTLQMFQDPGRLILKSQTFKAGITFAAVFTAAE